MEKVGHEIPMARRERVAKLEIQNEAPHKAIV